MNKNVLLRRHGLRLLLAPLALLISLSCSNKDKKTEAGGKKGLEKAAVTLPSGAIPLSAVLQSVENTGYTPVVEVEFEKDHWKIKAYRGGQLLQLKVDVFKGAVLPNPPPTLQRPLSAVIKALEDQGYGPILDVEPAEGNEGGAAWDVEAYKGKSEVKVSVDPSSGKITTK